MVAGGTRWTSVLKAQIRLKLFRCASRGRADAAHFNAHQQAGERRAINSAADRTDAVCGLGQPAPDLQERKGRHDGRPYVQISGR